MNGFAEEGIFNQGSFFSYPCKERSSRVSRCWLRLISVLCMAAYLLANTNVSFALEAWMRGKVVNVSQAPPDKSEERASKSRKCKRCSTCQIEPDQEAERQSSPREDHRKGNCQESSCPCCPQDSGQKRCPCPGGCALCSVAKAPCLTPVATDLPQMLCVGQCSLADPVVYHSPFCGGLERPPRI